MAIQVKKKVRKRTRDVDAATVRVVSNYSVLKNKGTLVWTHLWIVRKLSAF